MEHVADDGAAFRELCRVLKPGGALVFTVPLSGESKTIERAILSQGRLTHLLPPAYHGDRITGKGTVLVYRDYGNDILERVARAGFGHAEFIEPRVRWLGYSRKVIVARK
jgi:SAM-dependent methyltransferase